MQPNYRKNNTVFTKHKTNKCYPMYFVNINFITREEY